jgi:hypothetical protein
MREIPFSDLMTAQGGTWLEAAAIGPVMVNYRHLVIAPSHRGAGDSRKLYQTRQGYTGAGSFG